MSKKQQLLAIAIDDGSGNIATHHTDVTGKVIESIAPSCVVPRVLSDLTANVSSQAWKTQDGGSFSVTISDANQINTCTKDYQLSVANRVLVHNAISKLVDDQPVHLGCTLPTAQFYTGDNDHPIALDRIEDKRVNLMKSITNISGEAVSPIIDGITVYPEAIPAYVYCSQDENGNIAEDYPEEHTTLVVDLGRFTCDMAIVSTGYQISGYKTTENGVHKLTDYLLTLLNRNAISLGLSDTESYSEDQIKHIINRGYIGSNSEKDSAIAARKDVTPLITEAKEHLSSILFADMKELVKDFNMLTRIIFVGGGANWLEEQSNQWFHTVDIPTNPEMAIVRGTYLMLKPKVDSLNAEIIKPKKEEVELEEAQ